MLKILVKNKKNLSLVIILGLFLSLVPLYYSQASWVDDLLNSLGSLPIRIAGDLIGVASAMVLVPVFVLLIVGCLISFAFFTISLFFLEWVSSGDLITLGFTHGGIVDIGWNITRNFTNFGFVLILVFIALATILRLEAYHTIALSNLRPPKTDNHDVCAYIKLVEIKKAETIHRRHTQSSETTWGTDILSTFISQTHQ